MAKSEPVKVAVEIIDKFSDDLADLEAKLEKIDQKKLEVKLDIDDDGSIESVKAQLKELERKLDSTLDIDLSGHLSAKAMKKELGRDMYSTLHVKKNPMGHLGGGDSTGFDPPSLKGFSDAEVGEVNWIINDDVAGAMGKPPSHRGRVPGAFGAGQRYGRPNAYPRMDGFDTPFSPGGKDRDYGFDFKVPGGTNWMKSMFGLDEDAGDSEGISGSMQKLAKGLAKLKPNIMMVWNFLAALIPIFVTLIGAVVGLAAAFGALAVAGGAVLGLGLLGWGENTAEAMKNAKLRIQDLLGDLFDAVKPVSKAFQPIADELLGNLPQAVGRIAGSLESLAVFEDYIARAGGGLMNWLGRAIDSMVRFKDEAEQVGMRFGGIFGDLTVDLMEWGIQELYENQDAIVKLGGLLAGLVSVIYNLAAVIGFALAAFSPFIKLAGKAASLLNNKFTVGLLTALTTILLVSLAMWKLNAAVAAFSISSIGAALSSIPRFIGMLYQLFYSTQLAAAGFRSLASAIAMTGIGALAVGAGYLAFQSMDALDAPSGGGGGGDFGGYGGGSGGGGSTINIYGDVGNSEYQKMKDNFGSMYGEQSNIETETEK